MASLPIENTLTMGLHCKCSDMGNSQHCQFRVKETSLEIFKDRRYRDWTHLTLLKFPELHALPRYRIREYRPATQQAIGDLMFNFFYKHAKTCQFPEHTALLVAC